MAGMAWRLLRQALLWARKGGALKQKLVLDLRVVSSYLNSLRACGSSDGLRSGELEFSIDETPAFHFRMHPPASVWRLRIPCMTPPPVDFEEDDGGGRAFFGRGRRSCSFGPGEDNAAEGDNGGGEEYSCGAGEGGGIDLRAEEFIKRFYEQMKLQRQVSLIQYNEMLHRGTS